MNPTETATAAAEAATLAAAAAYRAATGKIVYSCFSRFDAVYLASYAAAIAEIESAS